MKRKQFVKGTEQIAQEGAIQIFKVPGSGMEEVIVGVVGVLQFDVFQYRMKNEYGVELRMDHLPYEELRLIDSYPGDLQDLNLGSDAELLEDYRDRKLLVFTSFWAIDFTCRRNPRPPALQKSPWTRTPGRPERLAARHRRPCLPLRRRVRPLDAPETGGSVIPSPSANPDLPHRLVRIRLGLAHTPAFYTGRQRPAFPGQGRGRCPARRKKEMLPPWPRPNSLLLKNGLCVTLNAFLEWNGFQKGVKACATDLISTVRNCSGGPALAGLCSAAEFRSLRHLSPCFSI